MLCSSSALPFSVVVHGSATLDGVVFRSGSLTSSSSARLPPLTSAFVGSPLIDVYAHALDLRRRRKTNGSEIAAMVDAYLDAFQK